MSQQAFLPGTLTTWVTESLSETNPTEMVESSWYQNGIGPQNAKLHWTPWKETPLSFPLVESFSTWFYRNATGVTVAKRLLLSVSASPPPLPTTSCLSPFHTHPDSSENQQRFEQEGMSAWHPELPSDSGWISRSKEENKKQESTNDHCLHSVPLEDLCTSFGWVSQHKAWHTGHQYMLVNESIR